MSVNEQIVTGRKFRKLVDEATKLWQRISIWNTASDTECEDGQSVETKIGSMKGITADTNTTETGYAADMTSVAQLYSNLGGITIYPETLTQAEYDALSDELKSTPKLWFPVKK